MKRLRRGRSKKTWDQKEGEGERENEGMEENVTGKMETRNNNKKKYRKKKRQH
jgi:hypothetical protein